MANALKDLYDKAFITQLSDEIQRHHSKLDAEAFHSLIFDNEWKKRELKARMQHISRCLHESLKMDFVDAIEVLKQAAPTFGGFEAMIFPDYVEQFGQNHWDDSMSALEELTQYSSSEFAVRPFILLKPEKMMTQMLRWSNHSNHHVRRLASEGCRPRLPWAMALAHFKNDPSPILPILENLKQDSSDYVRRSVANNLNDIAKDNPGITLKTANTWSGQHPHTDWIIKHGLRTLLKRGNKEALTLIGTHSSDHIKRAELTLENKQPRIGEALYLQADISAGSKELGKLRIDYHIDFVKKNGALSRKIFKLAEGNYAEKDRLFRKKHSLRQMSTRTHYPGTHHVTLVINGEEKSVAKFNLSTSDL
jgi:3-methyladenine DNA glycosylase AlkC